MSRYNLIDESWIPVRYKDGTHEEVGIWSTFDRSKEIAFIEDPSPLVTAAMHRFLLAILYRALEGPIGIKQVKEFIKDGIPNRRIHAYLEKWRNRFWLMDKVRPFGQNPHVPKNEIEPWTKLTAEHNSTTNKVFFDHTDTRNAGSRKLSECAKWLLSTMTFSISGGRGYYPSPSANGVFCIPIGEDLAETLLLNLVPYPNRDVQRDDSVLWEREPQRLPLRKPKRAASGYADLYTWQPRLIFFEESSNGEVAAMRFIAGSGFESEAEEPDPMQAYRIDPTKGRLPLQFREDRSAWRDFDSLLPSSEKGSRAPMTVEHTLNICREIPTIERPSLLVLGLRYTPPNANVDFWRMERFALPKTLSRNPEARATIRQLLEDAESSYGSLRSASRTFARSLLSHKEATHSMAKEINALSNQIPLGAWYWSCLENHFHELLDELSRDRDFEDVRRRWLLGICEALTTAWDRHRASVSRGDVWVIRAIVKAERILQHRLTQIRDEIRQLESVQEVP